MITNGFRFRVGVSLVFGLFWTSAALGDGPLFPGAQYAVGRQPSSVAIGDLNGDQVPDLAVANRAGSNLSVLLGVGDGTFAARMLYAAGGRPLSVAIGDLDGDHMPDLAVANDYAEKAVSVLLNQSSMPGEACQYKLKKDSKPRRGCEACPVEGDVVASEQNCDKKKDCDKKLKGKIPCPDGGRGSCKRIKGKRNRCG